MRRRRHSRILAAVAFLLSLESGNCTLAESSSTIPIEYKIKAAMLFNFMKFVEWPAAGKDTAGTPLVLCVLGKNPFGDALEEMTRDKVIDGRRIVVRYGAKSSELPVCQMVFVSKSENGRLAPALRELSGSNALTVGETDQFTRLGGIIRFLVEDENVRFEVSLGAVRRANLKISSQLLRLATIARE